MGTVSAPLAFTTGSLPANLNFPTFTVVQPPAAGTDLSQGEIFHAGVNTGKASINTVNTLATDLNGNVIWYYDPVANSFPGYAQNLEPGGTVMMLGGKAVGVAAGYDTLRQVDLAGDTLRETNIHAVNAELAAMHQPQILDFDHEAKLLPNGDTVVLAQHAEDRRLQGEAHQVHRRPGHRPGSELPAGVGLELLPLAQHQPPRHGSPDPDRLAARQLRVLVARGRRTWSSPCAPRTGSIKIDYANGTGNGHIVWKLGAGGNFKPIANTPDPWFSHQHDVRYINDNDPAGLR